ncbi:hypothetical protein [Haploplasma axanthum]|uniref:Uncharacterized protein n=1 Tax=Haploplasma axanthum TaxID=29552 RepID=A0A449BFM1_HAPAX|nr:hypothetical protein [Haploplasma axanthum]VEU81231.1 Uncharacterised protein [Haploplasma axanthum]
MKSFVQKILAFNIITIIVFILISGYVEERVGYPLYFGTLLFIIMIEIPIIILKYIKEKDDNDEE